jgi:flagellar basal-body rod protein FlgB
MKWHGLPARGLTDGTGFQPVVLVQPMFIEQLFNQDSAPVLEQVIHFTSARHKLITENIANIDTPGYRQKDLSVQKFQSMLNDRLESRRQSGIARFDDIDLTTTHPTAGILSLDRNNRSMEQLQTDLAKNAMLHNMAIELLRKQYAQLDMALKERVA